MSLIIARKYGADLIIVSDTKLTDKTGEFIRQQANPKAGILKTIFINDQICISFAGKWIYADEAIKQINYNDSIDKILEILLFCNQITSDKATEFIVCYGTKDPLIYEIKAGVCNCVDYAWIGDIDGFNKFQSYVLGDIKILDSISGSFLNIEGQYPQEIFSKISEGMDYVIQDETIKTVGGFKTIVFFTNRNFVYQFYVKMYTGVLELDGSPVHKTITHETPEKGGYTIHYFGSSKDLKHVGLHVKQGKFGIVYSRKDGGLSFPSRFTMDEVDFIDLVKAKFNISPSVITEDRYTKFIQDGIRLLNKGDLLEATKSLDKAFTNGNQEQKGKVLFYKGIAYLNMRRPIEANQCFMFAIKINPIWKEKIENLQRKK